MYLTQRKTKYILQDLNGKILIITSHKGVVKEMMEAQRDVENKQSVFKSSDIDSGEI